MRLKKTLIVALGLAVLAIQEVIEPRGSPAVPVQTYFEVTTGLLDESVFCTH